MHNVVLSTKLGLNLIQFIGRLNALVKGLTAVKQRRLPPSYSDSSPSTHGVTIQSCACAPVNNRFRREKPTVTRDLACLNPGLTIQRPCAFRESLGFSQRLTK